MFHYTKTTFLLVSLLTFRSHAFTSPSAVCRSSITSSSSSSPSPSLLSWRQPPLCHRGKNPSFQDGLKTRQDSSTLLHLSSSAASTSPSKENKIDTILSGLTTFFPFYVLGAAILAVVRPNLLQWVNQGNLISTLLAAVMCGTGLTLQKKDFTEILGTSSWTVVPLGVLCQFIIMPATAGLVGRSLLLNTASVGPALFLGCCLVGSSPGGTASNLVSLIANADVALSVLLTACSTLMAVFMTPLLVKLLVGSNVSVSGMALVTATARVVLLPVLAGMLINRFAPKAAKTASRFTPFASCLIVALICGGVVSQNAPVLLASSRGLFVRVLGSILLLHSVGFFAGYLVPKLLGQPEKSSRTISIEVGMQNSALAVVLAKSIGADPLASLPGALSATAHSCLGSILAAFWRNAPVKDNVLVTSNESGSEIEIAKDDKGDASSSSDETEFYL